VPRRRTAVKIAGGFDERAPAIVTILPRPAIARRPVDKMAIVYSMQ
jgi:hypothetical protein